MVFRSPCHGVGQIPAQMLSYLTNFLLLLVLIIFPITNTYSIVQYLEMKNVKKQNVRVLTFCPLMNIVLKIAGTIGLVVARKYVPSSSPLLYLQNVTLPWFLKQAKSRWIKLISSARSPMAKLPVWLASLYSLASLHFPVQRRGKGNLLLVAH